MSVTALRMVGFTSRENGYSGATMTGAPAR